MSSYPTIRVSVPWRGTGHFRDLRIWLIDNVRDSDYYHDGEDHNDPDHRIVVFSRQDDAAMFALRWS
jgi:hypothetical protein